MTRYSKSFWGQGKEKKKSRKRPLTTFQKQTGTLDSYFSEFIRLSHMDEKGLCLCFTCGAPKTWNNRKTHAGHFIPKDKHRAFRVRWDEKNVKPQCYQCNSNKEGSQYRFAMNLDKLYGPGTAAKLELKGTMSFNEDIFDMKKTIKYYREKVKHLRKTKLNKINLEMEFA